MYISVKDCTDSTHVSSNMAGGCVCFVLKRDDIAVF